MSLRHVTFVAAAVRHGLRWKQPRDATPAVSGADRAPVTAPP